MACGWQSLIFLLDMSSTAFIEPLPVIEFVNQLLNMDVVQVIYRTRGNRSA
ncbi:hypothetical protein Tco_0434143, partial [Tanacetum coccineum]